MTNNGVRNGASPRGPNPSQPTPPAADQAARTPSPAGSEPDDWLAPEASPDAAAGAAPAGQTPSAVPATDWLAPEPPMNPETPVEPPPWAPQASPPPEPPRAPQSRLSPPRRSAPQPPVAPEPAYASEPAYAPAYAPDYAPAYAPVPLEAGSAEADDESAAENALEPELPKVPLLEQLKRTSPGVVILSLAALGSAGFLLAQVASHTSPIPVLTSAGVVTGLIYMTITVVCAISSYRAATEGLTARSYVLALVGGGAAIVAGLSFAGALVLFLALGF